MPNRAPRDSAPPIYQANSFPQRESASLSQGLVARARYHRAECRMAEHFNISPHMTAADFDCPIRNTYLGQAHIAGTGPEGTTCRQCKHWGKTKFIKYEHGNYVEKFAPPNGMAKSTSCFRASRKTPTASSPSSTKQNEPSRIARCRADFSSRARTRCPFSPVRMRNHAG